MAQGDVVIKVVVDTANSAKTVGDLKNSIKDMQKLLSQKEIGSEQFNKLTKAIAEAKGKIGDLNQSIKQNSGSGIEKLNTNVALLQEGLQNFDVGKITSGLKGLGSAMAAVPVFLLVQGFTLLIENFGKVIDFGRELFDIFTDEQRAIRQLTAELENQKEATGKLSKELQREIDIMEAQGVSSDKILIKKKELIKAQIDEAFATAKLNIAKAREIENNDNLLETALRLQAATARKFGFDQKAEEFEKAIAVSKQERNKENIKAVNDSLELIKDLQNKGKVEEIKVNNELTANYKKNLEERKKAADDLAAYNAKRKQMEIDSELAAEEYLKNQKNAIKEEGRTFEQAMLDLTAQQQLAAGQKELEEAKKLADQKAAYRISTEEQSVKALHALSDVYYMFQLNRVKGNATQELAIKKQAFIVNKAFQLSEAGIDGTRAVLSAYATAPPGFKTASAILASAFALAQIGKIAAAKFDAGGSASVDVSAPSNNSVSSNTPQINTTAPIINPTTAFNSQGQNLNYNITAKVYEGEMTKAQDRTAKLESQRTI